MKVFVTGATGVVGRRAVARLLAEGAEVTGVARTRAKLQEVLASDVVAYSDGGGKARAARHPVVGVDRVLAFFGALRRHRAIAVERRVEVNGQPGAMLWFGRQYQLLTVDVRRGKVREILSVMNPDKLAYLGAQLTTVPPR